MKRTTSVRLDPEKTEDLKLLKINLSRLIQTTVDKTLEKNKETLKKLKRKKEAVWKPF